MHIRLVVGSKLSPSVVGDSVRDHPVGCGEDPGLYVVGDCVRDHPVGGGEDPGLCVVGDCVRDHPVGCGEDPGLCVVGDCVRDHPVGGGGDPGRNYHFVGPLVSQKTRSRQYKLIRYYYFFVMKCSVDLIILCRFSI